MKKLQGMKKNFSSLENKKLADLESISGGSTGDPSNNHWSQASVNEYNCADIDTYVDGKHTQRQECLTEACDNTNVVTK
ncbi:TIGR04139 family peptide modification target [uncultured Chryseobacterium sp.]|uniref:TIGR04139 family peptide modification target n=1 Tax=uncultured Chryseobacterium sp. TaxID=259322 RepID=UPI0025CE7BD4|nr:TIGR04139 family peptide modification target [uncultured Chryseobacterium sp.]